MGKTATWPVFPRTPSRKRNKIKTCLVRISAFHPCSRLTRFFFSIGEVHHFDISNIRKSPEGLELSSLVPANPLRFITLKLNHERGKALHRTSKAQCWAAGMRFVASLFLDLASLCSNPHPLVSNREQRRPHSLSDQWTNSRNTVKTHGPSVDTEQGCYGYGYTPLPSG